MSDTSDLKESVRSHAADLGTQAKAAATQEAVAQADRVKDTAAGKVEAAANVADAAAGELDPSSPQAQAMQQVADHIEGVAQGLRNADIRDIAVQATDLARRNPMLFIGGAAIAGFAVARFLKARDPQPTATHEDDPWGSSGESSADINGGRFDA